MPVNYWQNLTCAGVSWQALRVVLAYFVFVCIYGWCMGGAIVAGREGGKRGGVGLQLGVIRAELFKKHLIITRCLGISGAG